MLVINAKFGPVDWKHWQDSWDAQQRTFMPDREERFRAMLDVVEAIAGDAPRVLDLAAGTGSITRRLLGRLPAARSVVLDVDPALLAIAAATFADDDRVTVVRADLARPQWLPELPDGRYDAVVTATALHWLPADRVRALYGEVRDLLRDGGVLLNADHLEDPGLPGLSERLAEWERSRRDAAYAADPALDWAAWWDAARRDPDLGPLVAERDARFGGDHARSEELPVGWHVEALRAAGFREAGVVWRGLLDAAVAGVR